MRPWLLEASGRYPWWVPPEDDGHNDGIKKNLFFAEILAKGLLPLADGYQSITISFNELRLISRKGYLIDASHITVLG